MTPFRFIALAMAISSTSLLTACSTAPAMQMGKPSAASMGTAEHMAKMDMQMKAMREMHEKMMNARTPDERNKLMADHMKTMQDGMAMMGSMSGAGMGDMKSMQGNMGAHQQMMTKRMEMMQSMMQMMMDRMPAPAKQ